MFIKKHNTKAYLLFQLLGLNHSKAVFPLSLNGQLSVRKAADLGGKVVL